MRVHPFEHELSFQRVRAACNLRNQFNDIETPAVGIC